MSDLSPVDQTAALFRAMSIQDLVAYASCPIQFQEHFEQVMMEKYGIAGVA